MAKALIFPALADLAIQLSLLWWLCPERGERGQSTVFLFPAKNLQMAAATLTVFVVVLPITEVAFLGATMLLITRRINPEKVFKQIH
ncbi:MAG: hypothetical protein NZ901_02715 [Geminocystis sp.]|nr:hypothetical protein [Geminocystis sp.]HIK36995.1 hypothetical protein [Geminocystis sp. M7585_C2015_104]MCS7147084.1 hypothetical protein [Geminocystis sp.]MCX8079165.1 hypothetical protein [Geminocystis sp.]MDW8116720.1 hypothetical protein [Geminocystis sp.]